MTQATPSPQTDKYKPVDGTPRAADGGQPGTGGSGRVRAVLVPKAAPATDAPAASSVPLQPAPRLSVPAQP